jgi:hypothetical protein
MFVITGLVPVIHASAASIGVARVSWMAGTSPAMTINKPGVELP